MAIFLDQLIVKTKGLADYSTMLNLAKNILIKNIYSIASSMVEYHVFASGLFFFVKNALVQLIVIFCVKISIMTYTSSIDNIASKRWGLNLSEAYLFSFIFYAPTWCELIMINSNQFYFLSKTNGCFKKDYFLEIISSLTT